MVKNDRIRITLGEKLKSARKGARLTQGHLAEKLQIRNFRLGIFHLLTAVLFLLLRIAKNSSSLPGCFPLPNTFDMN